MLSLRENAVLKKVRRLEEVIELFQRVEDEGWDIRSINSPTGGDDYVVVWVVFEHYQRGPDRQIGFGATIVDAVQDAVEACNTKGGA